MVNTSKDAVCGKHKYGTTLLYITIPNKKEYGENLTQHVRDFRSGFNDRLSIRSEALSLQDIEIKREDDHYTLRHTHVIRMDEAEYTELEKVLLCIAHKANKETTSALSHSTSSSALMKNE
jgi:hypothetical protein